MTGPRRQGGREGPSWVRADVSSHLPTQHAQVTYFRTCPLASMACGDFHVLALGQDGRVYAWGYGAEGQGGLGATLQFLRDRLKV